MPFTLRPLHNAAIIKLSLVPFLQFHFNGKMDTEWGFFPKQNGFPAAVYQNLSYPALLRVTSIPGLEA